jgi:hypothetical protein
VFQNSQQEIGMQRDQRQGREGMWKHVAILSAIVLVTAVLRTFPAWTLAHGPSCVFRSVLHLNCPFCGMTRDFVAILHGQQPSLNRFSWMAAFVVYLGYPVLFVWALWHRRLSVFHQPVVHRAVIAAMAVMLVVNNLRY